MPTRKISLTPDQDAFIDEMLRAGEYRNASAAIRDAIRALQQRRAMAALKESLRSKPATGYRVGTITEDDKYGGDYRAGLYALSKRGLLRDGMTPDEFMTTIRGNPDRDAGFKQRPKRKRG